MKVLAALLAAIAIAAETPPVTAEDLLAEPRPETIDYFALKSQIGARGLLELRRGLMSILDRQGRGYAGPGCMSPAQARVLTSLMLAAQVDSAEAFAADRAAGEALIAGVERDWASLQAGERVAPQYEGVLTWLRRAREAADPRLQELYRRTARDQFVRVSSPVAGLSGGVIANRPAFYASQIRIADWCAVDLDNTAWLKGQLKEQGWFKLSRYGPDADTAAFLMVQHADRDRAFQREVLPLLEKLAAEKETQPRTHAYLYDRIAVAEKRPQRYATQGRYTDAKAWEPWPTEDLPNIDKVREGVGLGALAAYRSGFKCP